MKFKADVYVEQESIWLAGWTSPICANYRQRYDGSGFTRAVYRKKGIPVRFKRAGGVLVTNDFAMKGSLTRDAEYSVSEAGDKGQCPPGAATTPVLPDTSKCGTVRVRRSGKSFALAVVRGRLGPLGTFTGNGGRDPFGSGCPDQGFASVTIDQKPSSQRRDVHKLLARKNVRSISLSSYEDRDIAQSRMGFPAGDEQTGSGKFEGRWTVKLRRVR
jgi:hypothetical protein